MSLSRLQLVDLLPDRRVRQVRNIQFIRDDIVPLVTHEQNHLKLTNCPIDIFGALLQESREPDATFFMFSSWLGPLAHGLLKVTSSTGTLEENIAAACPSHSCVEVLSRDRWCIPLCGGNPPHWVLSIIDFKAQRVGMFDSFPELNSMRWAKPMIIGIINAIYKSLGSVPIDWDRWHDKLFSPPQFCGQCDSWSCGLFVMMAMEAVAADMTSFKNCTRSRLANIRADAMQMILNAPLVQENNENLRACQGGNNNREDRNDDDQDKTGDGGNSGCEGRVKGESGGDDTTDPNRDMPMEEEAISLPVTRSLRTAPAKRGIDLIGVEDDPYNTDDEGESARKAKRKKKQRSKRLSPEEKRQVLEDDEHTLGVEKHRVKCSGCKVWIKMSAARDYDICNWTTHKSRCPKLTGETNKRLAIVKAPKFLGSETDRSITSFFQCKSSNFAIADPSASLVMLPPPKQKIRYAMKTVKAEPTLFDHCFAIQESSGPDPSAKVLTTVNARPCVALSGPQYEEYVLRTHTRSLGGVSPLLRARVARQLFAYKPFPPMKNQTSRQGSDQLDGRNGSSDEEEPAEGGIREEIPENGNHQLTQSAWTLDEKKEMDSNLAAFARWEIEYERRTVRSSICRRLTHDVSRICDACAAIALDPSLRDAIRRKVAESKLPEEEQRAKQLRREKYAPTTFRSVEDRNLQILLKDPLILDLFHRIERDQNTGCFLRLYKYAIDGKLKGFETFTQICDVLADRIRRLEDPNGTLKYGQRYPQNYLNFMTLLRSYGGQSARQYAIVTTQIGGPSARHLRTLVANSEDALQNPDLIFENVARVKRFVDSIKYTGPIAVAGDCTKVKQRLSYSNDFGGHVIGSTLPIEECIVESSEDIDGIIDEAKSKKAIASQIPRPGVPPLAIALLPTTGNDSAAQIHEQHLLILRMAAQLLLKVISFAADGAASELAAQCLMDSEKTDLPPLIYQHKAYGVHIAAVVFPITGPIVSITDPSHAVKTCRNQPQHGTHTASCGRGYIVNCSLVDLYETGVAGLVQADVKDVDKQDDGAARRLFHHQALLAMTYEENGEHHIQEDMEGLFVYLFIFGELFDAWLNRKLDVESRLLGALRARFFLHIWRTHIVNFSIKYPDLYSTTRSFISPASFNIFNRLCDTLIALALIYATHYPDIPFCPWLLGTEFVEHFFGLARSFLPDFTYAQFLTLVKHVMLRQRILLTGKFKEKTERTSRTGYLFDFDNSPLTGSELAQAQVQITPAEIDKLVEIGYADAASVLWSNPEALTALTARRQGVRLRQVA